MKNTKEYRTWRGIRSRCNNPKDHNWQHYGRLGVSVCDRWNSFENFYKDIGPCPDKTYSIERIDPLKGYSPENCKWIPLKEQQLNRRDTRWVIYCGERVRLQEVASKLKIPYWRLSRVYVENKTKTIEEIICLTKLKFPNAPNSGMRPEKKVSGVQK